MCKTLIFYFGIVLSYCNITGQNEYYIFPLLLTFFIYRDKAAGSVCSWVTKLWRLKEHFGMTRSLRISLYFLSFPKLHDAWATIISTSLVPSATKDYSPLWYEWSRSQPRELHKVDEFLESYEDIFMTTVHQSQEWTEAGNRPWLYLPWKYFLQNAMGGKVYSLSSRES